MGVLLAYFPRAEHDRVAKGLEKIGDRMVAFIIGQSIISGGMVAGAIGAIAVLPVVAAYPALAVLWLGPKLEPNVVKDHQQQLRAA